MKKYFRNLELRDGQNSSDGRGFFVSLGVLELDLVDFGLLRVIIVVSVARCSVHPSLMSELQVFDCVSNAGVCVRNQTRL